jgi:hypothetical protein
MARIRYSRIANVSYFFWLGNTLGLLDVGIRPVDLFAKRQLRA